MPKLRLLLLLIVMSLMTTSYVQGQRQLLIRVVDYAGQPVPNVKVCPNSNGNYCRMDSGNKVTIDLTPEQIRSRSLEVKVLTSGYILINPWDNRIQHDTSTGEIEVRVFHVGDKKALKDGRVLISLLKMFNSKSSLAQKKGAPEAYVQESGLVLTARAIGTTPSELHRLIEAHRQSASASEKGQYELFLGNLKTARDYFLKGRKIEDPQNRKTAENEFFLGQVQFRLGEHKEAAKSFTRAQSLGMEDEPELLDYLATLDLLKGNLSGAYETVERSLEIRKRTLDADDPELLAGRVVLLPIYLEAGKLDEAQDLLDGIWTNCEGALAKDFGRTAPALLALIEIYDEVLDDLNSDYDFDAEVDWLKKLLKTTAQREVEAKHVKDLRAGAQLLAVYTARDGDDLDDDERAEIEKNALQLLRFVRLNLSKNSKSNSRGRARGRSARAIQRFDPNDVAWAIYPLLKLAEHVSDDKTRTQLFNEAIRLTDNMVKQDPTQALFLLSAAASARSADPSITIDLRKKIFEIAEGTRVVENPLVAETVVKNAINSYQGIPTEEEVRSLFERMTTISRNVWGNDHALDAVALMQLAISFDPVGEGFRPEARKLIEWPLNRVVTNVDEILKTPSWEILEGLGYIAEVCNRLKRLEDAQLIYTKILDTVEKNWVRNPLITECLEGIAEAQEGRQQRAEAAATYQRAIDYEKRRLGPKHPAVAKLMVDRAEVLKKINRRDEAAKLEEEAEAIFDEQKEAEQGRWQQLLRKRLNQLKAEEAKVGPNDSSLIKLLSELAEACDDKNNYQEAARIYEKLLLAYGKAKDVGVADVPRVHRDYGRVLRQLEKYDEAEANYRKGVALLEEAKTPGLLLPDILEEWADLLMNRGRQTEAAELNRRAAELRKNK